MGGGRREEGGRVRREGMEVGGDRREEGGRVRREGRWEEEM